MSIRIVPIDPDHERDFEDVAALLTAYWREVLGPEEPPASAAEIRDGMHLDRPDIDCSTLIVRDDADRAVGYASVDIRSGHGNEHMAYAEDVFVLPAERRRGIGRALLAEVTGIATAAGRTLVLGGYDEGNADGAGFAASVGAALGNRDRQNRVRVADLDRALLESWNVPPPGYSLVTFDDVCPDDLMGEVVRLANVMNDAPKSDKLTDTEFTADFHRAAEVERANARIAYWYVGARLDATGELAGFTEMGWRPDKPWLVEQGDTGVSPAHRGHGIGRWLKAVNALRVLDERPAARVIETWNDGTNKWMLAINDAMGFRPVATWIETELEV